MSYYVIRPRSVAGKWLTLIRQTNAIYFPVPATLVNQQGQPVVKMEVSLEHGDTNMIDYGGSTWDKLSIKDD